MLDSIISWSTISRQGKCEQNNHCLERSIASRIALILNEIFVIFAYSKVPAYLNVVDIAGLVKGAAEGQGLGNAFLSHISACDAIFHLCRMFKLKIVH